MKFPMCEVCQQWGITPGDIITKHESYKSFYTCSWCHYMGDRRSFLLAEVRVELKDPRNNRVWRVLPLSDLFVMTMTSRRTLELYNLKHNNEEEFPSIFSNKLYNKYHHFRIELFTYGKTYGKSPRREKIYCRKHAHKILKRVEGIRHIDGRIDSYMLHAPKCSFCGEQEHDEEIRIPKLGIKNKGE